MANERIICCCGASSWSAVIAWFKIVISAILIIVYSLGLAGFVVADQTDAEFTYAVAISLVMAVLGLIMGIILLKGTWNKKRVGFLRAWLIYGLASIFTNIVSLIINAINIYDGGSIGYLLGTGVFGIAIDVFCVAVVYIHMKEINEAFFVMG